MTTKDQRNKHPFYPPIYSKMDYHELIDLFDEAYPISLKGHEKILERVFDRYPYIPKTEVAWIIKSALNVFRDQYLIGNKLLFPGMIAGLHILLTPHKRSYWSLQNQIPRLYCFLRTKIQQLPPDLLRAIKENIK